MSRDQVATLPSSPLTIRGDESSRRCPTAACEPTRFNIADQILALTFPTKREQCPNAQGWLRGTCTHGNQRWVRLSCKRRDCPVCGEIRRQLISYRVQLGLQILHGGAWFVGTWDWQVDKKQAVITQNHFIRWLRRDMRLKVQYAAVWELQANGRLHLNLVLSPWKYIDQRLLSSKWTTFGGGPVIWIEKVDGGLGDELAKTRRRFGNYMAKFEQQVRTGRGINYSRLWPKLPSNPLARRGQINWVWLRDDYPESEQLEQDIDLGFMSEIHPGEYNLCGQLENCDCFYYDEIPHRARDSIIDLTIIPQTKENTSIAQITPPWVQFWPVQPLTKFNPSNTLI